MFVLGKWEWKLVDYNKCFVFVVSAILYLHTFWNVLKIINKEVKWRWWARKLLLLPHHHHHHLQSFAQKEDDFLAATMTLMKLMMLMMLLMMLCKEERMWKRRSKSMSVMRGGGGGNFFPKWPAEHFPFLCSSHLCPRCQEIPSDEASSYFTLTSKIFGSQLLGFLDFRSLAFTVFFFQCCGRWYLACCCVWDSGLRKEKEFESWVSLVYSSCNSSWVFFLREMLNEVPRNFFYQQNHSAISFFPKSMLCTHTSSQRCAHRFFTAAGVYESSLQGLPRWGNWFSNLTEYGVTKPYSMTAALRGHDASVSSRYEVMANNNTANGFPAFPPDPQFARPDPPQSQNPGPRPDGSYFSRSFNSNVVVVMAVLLFALVVAAFINTIARCMLRRSRANLPDDVQIPEKGLEKSEIEALPVVAYGSTSTVHMVGTDRECVVCLSEFVRDEQVRLLPVCKHGFHLACIDTWLLTHTSCPVCRHSVLDGSCPVGSDDPSCSEERCGSSRMGSSRLGSARFGSARIVNHDLEIDVGPAGGPEAAGPSTSRPKRTLASILSTNIISGVGSRRFALRT